MCLMSHWKSVGMNTTSRESLRNTCQFLGGEGGVTGKCGEDVPLSQTRFLFSIRELEEEKPG